MIVRWEAKAPPWVRGYFAGCLEGTQEIKQGGRGSQPRKNEKRFLTGEEFEVGERGKITNGEGGGK